MLAAECKVTLDFALEEFKREAKTDKSIKILGKTDKFFITASGTMGSETPVE